MANQPSTPISSRRRDRSNFKIEEVETSHYDFPSNRQGPSTPHPQTVRQPKSAVSPVAQAAAAQSSQVTQSPGNASTKTSSMLDLPPGHPLNDPQRFGLKQSRNASSEQNFTQQGTAQGNEQRLPDAETNPDYYSVALLSNFKFYPFQVLSARHLKAVHQAKFNRANKEKKIRFMVEALSSTLGDGVSAFDLTPSDFYFLLYWQRINSYLKNPQLIPYNCTNADHIRRTVLNVEDPEYLDPKTLDISTILNSTLLRTEYLETLDVEPYRQLIEKYDLHVETMRDIVDFSEMEEEIQFQAEITKSDDASEVQTRTVQDEDQTEESIDEISWLAARAVFLRRTEGRSTLQQRIEIVKQMDPDEISDLDKYIDAVTNYGVYEHAILKCKECGASHRVNLSVDALTFLP